MNSYLKIIYLILITGLLPYLSQGQDSSPEDSRWETWNDSSLHDTLRLEALIEILKKQNRLENYDSVKVLGELFIALADQPGYEDFQSEYYIEMARGPLWNSFEEAKETLEKSNAIAIAANNKKHLMVGQYFLADLYATNEQPHQAIQIFLQSLKNGQEIGHDIGSYNALIALGMAYRNLGDYPQSIKYFLQSEKIAEKMDFTNPLSRSYSFIGDVYRLNKDYSNALIYYKKSLDLTQGNKEHPNIPMKYYNIGATYNKLGDYSKALEYANKAYDAAKASPIETDRDYYISYALDLFGEIYQSQKKFKESIQYFQQSLRLGKKRQTPYAIAYSSYLIGYSYLKLGDYDRAIEYCEDAKRIFVRIERPLNEKNACECLYNAYKKAQKFKAALIEFERVFSLNDSLKGTESALRLQKMEFEKEILSDSLIFIQEKVELEAEHHQALQRKNRIQMILLVAGIIGLVIAFGFWNRLRLIAKTKTALEIKNRQIEAEKEKAKASEKAKQTFLANMSHEIRTPMNAIKGMTDILLRRNPVDEQLNYLRAIKESSHSLLVIINDILDISKLEAGKVELEEINFSLEKVLDNVKTIMGFKAEEKSLNLKMNIAEGTPRSLNGDPTRLHQILINLVGNAIKFTEEGGVTVKVDAGFQDETGKKRFRFSVIDTGIGMDADRIDKIFKSFEQAYADTSRKYGGTGLGLSISKQLVELQDGKIWAESEKGKGSTFHFEIPYAVVETLQEKTKKASKLSTEEITARLKGIRILLVEDNQFNAIVAQEELEDSIEEVEVVVAENGEIAIEKIKNEDFDIVLMDVQMPVMNGYDATQGIRQLDNEKSQTPIIAMTANVMKEEVERCYEAGMDDFIGKPFEIEDLLGKMEGLV
jgi:signal transduction histidine kinase/ActR/RegA family two-component response regulator